ncbi:hypothetical protein HHK36_007247 [Tetracentron sinense]|uniref:Uncharacterized protein n=1 Tax=Tetracentron sinense TaxID=13715 RepID=A0A834ZM58_TETSI|nr:hypothetical protein HHK36_007247 [Tetracentron sinense]
MVDGDKNSKFFHAVVNQRRKNNFISSMTLVDCTILSIPEQVHQGAVCYFQEILSGAEVSEVADLSPLLDKVIADEDNFFLCNEPTELEVKEALLSIPKHSSPGPDGFGFGFFSSCWELVKDDVVEAAKEFFSGAKYVKKGHVALASDNGSRFWKSVMGVLPEVLENVRLMVKEGKRSFWYDRWLSSGPLSLYSNVDITPSLCIKDLWVENSWDKDKLVELVGSVKTEEIVQTIAAGRNGEDVLVWMPRIQLASKCDCCVFGQGESRDHVLSSSEFAGKVWALAEEALAWRLWLRKCKARMEGIQETVEGVWLAIKACLRNISGCMKNHGEVSSVDMAMLAALEGFKGFTFTVSLSLSRISGARDMADEVVEISEPIEGEEKTVPDDMDLEIEESVQNPNLSEENQFDGGEKAKVDDDESSLKFSNGDSKRSREDGGDSEAENGVLKKQKVEKSVEEKRLEKFEESEAKEEQKSDDTVSLGPKNFSSSEEMFEYFYKFLHNWPPNLNVNKYEHMVLLDLLKKGHAEPEKKVGGGVHAFQVRYHPTWKSRCFFLIRHDESVDDFSFRKCVDHLLPLPDNLKIKSAVNKVLGGGRGGGNRGRRGGGGRRGGHARGRRGGGK